jgi:hypothetical protein
MASPLQGRVKRLEASAGLGETRYYALLPEAAENIEEWQALYCSGVAHNVVHELKSLMPGAIVRNIAKHIRSGSLEACIAAKRSSLKIGRHPPQFWVCSDEKDASNLVSELAEATAFSHAFVFTDLADELRLGPGRHRIDQ